MQRRLEFKPGKCKEELQYAGQPPEIKNSIKPPNHMPRIKGFASKGIGISTIHQF